MQSPQVLASKAFLRILARYIRSLKETFKYGAYRPRLWMSSPFAFIPRSVSKGTTHGAVRDSVPQRHMTYISQGNITGPSTTRLPPSGTKHKDAQLGDDELFILIEAALSDYSLWCNLVLQHEMKSTEEGYLPVKLVLSQSTLFSTLSRFPSEPDIMRCIRTSPSSNLETRMLITEPSRNEWFSHSLGASNSCQQDNGGFEVRRKDWRAVLQALAENVWTKEWWDQRTIYIERIPVAYRSINAVARYIQSLLRLHSEAGPAASKKILIQSIMFPPHHLASQDKPARCKGFAFIILDSPSLVDNLCRSYPWDSSLDIASADAEAVKFGTRVLSKTSWEALKSEYLSYQRHLRSQIAEAADEQQAEADKHEEPLHLESHHPSREASPQSETDPQTPSWFPQNCLLFVRNVHPDTNKTTLRTFFSSFLGSSKGAIDYVDFTKGIDTCHIRLASPSDAAQLMSCMTTQNIAQLDALDQLGSAPTKERPRIQLEFVKGKREKLYWEKVPGKVRNAAVARLQGARDQPIREESDNGQRRKRRKKG